MKKLLLLLTLSTVCAFAQPCSTVNALSQRYKAVDTKSLSSASEMLTIQHDTTSKAIVCPTKAVIQCSVACTVTAVYQNTSAATSTPLTVQKYNASAAPKTLAYSASNAGTSGGFASEPYTIAANVPYVLDLSGFYLDTSTVSQNLSVLIASMTGTVTVTIEFVEQ